MRRTRLAAVAVFAMLTAACSGPLDPPSPNASTATSYPPGTSVAALAESGTIRIGVKTDVPSLGYLPPGAPTGSAPEGFDIEIAAIVAADLGITRTAIQWVALQTSDREPALTDGKVDLVIASFSMTDERGKVVGQAGPYYLTGQQIMVGKGSDITGIDDLKGKTVCSVAGSESDAPLVAKGAITKAYGSYGACVDALVAGDLDAVSTDGALLSGYLQNHPDALVIVGAPFTTQRYGIGFRHGDTAMCQFLRASLLGAYEDGSWKQAFESTIGKTGIEAPRPPRPDKCPSAE